MANILIKDLTAGTPALTDLLIFANPTTGLAKKTTISTFRNEINYNLEDLKDVVSPFPFQSVLTYEDGEWTGKELKTINGNSLFGSGNIVIAGGSGLTSLNALTASSQTFATSSTGTDFTITSATSTHTFNLPSASATNRGLLTAANWTTFNNKQAALVSGTNIKTINGNTILGSGDLVLSSITSLNGLTAGTQLFAVASTGTDFTITSTTDTHTFAIPTASASARGLLSSANWTTFNNKVGGSGTTNYLSKFTAADTVGNSLIFDNASFIGINLAVDNSSGALLQVNGGVFLNGAFVVTGSDTNLLPINGGLKIYNDIASKTSYITCGKRAVEGYSLDIGGDPIVFRNSNLDTVIATFKNGNLLIGTSTNIPSSKLTIDSTTQGVLNPRMTTTQINAIASPATGLEVFNTTIAQPCFYDGTTWKKVSHSNMN